MIHLGPFAVSASAAQAAAFGQAIGAESGSGAGAENLPLTYPVVWLLGPDCRAALMAALGGGAAQLPVHLDQRVQRHAPLRVGKTYAMALDVTPYDERGAFAVAAEIRDDQGQVMAQLSARLALVAA